MCKLLCVTAAVTLTLIGSARAGEQADARAIIDAAIKAHGGEAVLSKIVAAHFKGKGEGIEGGQKAALCVGFTIQGRDKLRVVALDPQNQPRFISVVNGKQGWLKLGDQATIELSGPPLENFQEFLYVNRATLLVPLKEAEFQLSLLEESSIDGRKAFGVLVKHEGKSPLKLYFDKQTHLLVKDEHKTKNPETGQEVIEDSVFSDFRELDGIKQPFHIVITWDGTQLADFAISEQKLSDKPLDEKLFARP